MTGSRSELSEGWPLTPEAGRGADRAARIRRQAIVELARASESGMDFVVQGDCMAPLLNAGDRVRIEATRVYFPGDVIAFLESEAPPDLKQERLLMHRLLGYDRRQGQWMFVTGSDAAVGFDPPVARHRILGRVVAVASHSDDEQPQLVGVRIGPGARWTASWRFLKLARRALARRFRKEGHRP